MLLSYFKRFAEVVLRRKNKTWIRRSLESWFGNLTTSVSLRGDIWCLGQHSNSSGFAQSLFSHTLFS